MRIKKGLICILMWTVMLFLTACSKNTPEKESEKQRDNDEKPTELAETEPVIGKDDTLLRIFTGIKEEYKDTYLPVTEYTQEMIKKTYGISPLWYHAAIVETAAIDSQPDTFMGFLVKPEYKEPLLQKVTEYKTKLLEERPEDLVNASKIEASQILVYDEYVFFVMLGMIDDTRQDISGLRDSFSEENLKAIRVIEQYIDE